MHRLVFSPGNPRGARAVLRWAALLMLALCAMRPLAAWASCFPISDATYLALDPQVDKNATQTLATVAARFQALERTGSPPDPRQLAALYAVKADAYSILELDHEARATALKGLALVSGATDPLRLELLSTSSLNIYTQDGIRDAMATIEAARDGKPADSLSRVCLEIALGTLQRRAGENVQATRTLIHAYHDTETPDRAAAHSRAASALSSALRAVGDFEEALTLQREGSDGIPSTAIRSPSRCPLTWRARSSTRCASSRPRSAPSSVRGDSAYRLATRKAWPSRTCGSVSP